jgi:hypothetical protein
MRRVSGVRPNADWVVTLWRTPQENATLSSTHLLILILIPDAANALQQLQIRERTSHHVVDIIQRRDAR